MGSLWASFLRELATPFRLGEKVGSGVPKESVLGALGLHLGGFGMIFRRFRLRFEYPFLRYALAIPKVFFKYSSGVL